MDRSEIWLLNFDPTIGDEIKKIRPAVIVSSDSMGILLLKVVVPITDWKDRYTRWPWMAQLDPDVANGLTKVSAADTFQVRSLSQQRFIRRLGKLSDAEMQGVTKALANVLRLKS